MSHFKGFPNFGDTQRAAARCVSPKIGINVTLAVYCDESLFQPLQGTDTLGRLAVDEDIYDRLPLAEDISERGQIIMDLRKFK